MLDKYDELEFISRLNLPKQRRVPIGFNFPCPLCKEGKSKNKRRAFILTNNKRHYYNVFHCHNCGINLSFKNFLKEVDPVLFEEYKEKEKRVKLEKLKTSTLGKNKSIDNTLEYDLKYIKLSKDFIPVEENLTALKYCQKRKIPKKVIENMYYCKEGSILDDDVMSEYDMIIFPFYDHNKVYGYQGRSIFKKFFYTNSIEGFKVYNLFNVNLEEPVYIFESIIDSLFTENSIAMIGSDLSEFLTKKIKYPIFVHDNDFTEITLNKIEKDLNNGFKVVIFPEDLKEKDINEMILNGWTKQKIKELLEKNTYSGFNGKIRVGLLKGKKFRR